jgi:hypothetical protein
MTINELGDYFKAATLPKELVLHKSTRIMDVRKCVNSYIAIAKQYEGRPTADVFLDHLLQIKAAIDG